MGTCYLFVLLLLYVCFVVGDRLSAVKEVDSMLFVQETINTRRIEMHLQLWSRELLTSPEKLDRLVASRVVRESTLLLSSLSAASGVASGREEVFDNSHHRYKRNILGDFLHVVTGVATSEELAKQLKIDSEIRDKITSTLTHQLAFEKTISAVYVNLTREEESIQRRLDELSARGESERGRQARLVALTRLALDDIEELEDVLEAVRLGVVNSRHATRLSYKAGLNSVGYFSVVNVTGSAVGPVVRYVARLYSTGEVRSVGENELYRTLVTKRDAYLLHKSHDMSALISEMEVRGGQAVCTGCALMVYLGDSMYRVVKDGSVVCRGEEMKVNVGGVVNLGAGEECVNAAMRAGSASMKTREILVDLEDSSGLDALLLRRTVDNGGLVHESAATRRQQHLLGSLKLQGELSAAQQELSTFIEVTKMDMSTDYVQTNITWGVVGGLSLIVGVILTCICCRFLSNKSSSTIVVPTLSASNLSAA